MSLVVSLCIIRLEICNDEADMSSRNHKFHRGRRSIRDLKIHTYVNKKNESAASPLLPSTVAASYSESKENSKRKLKNETEACGSKDVAKDQISFVSGNPFVEVTKGILHLYKEDVLTVVDHDSFYSQIVCILAVPATMTCHDLLTYTAAWNENIQSIRIIRDGSINQYMALIYFRSKDSTVEFYNACNGTPFNSLEPENICQLVYVSRVEVLNEDEGVSTPPAGHTELPTCPVCLERMDESVDGILTILCNHSFHSSCLVKWGDISCPVCRYVQTPEVVAENKCFECHSSESLWICLICGYVGCGRYVQGHARKHYIETSHCYSMQLGNNRVWDYAGDNFVHRLLQNKADGKLVEGPSPEKNNGSQTEEKMDSIQLEYTYLLTSQLESQRAYYEEKMENVKRDLTKGFRTVKADAKKMASEKQELEVKLNVAVKEKQSLDKKVHQLMNKLSQAQAELNDEKQITKSLQMNQVEWQKKFTTLEKEFNDYKTSKEMELKELKEQLRDIMFFLEAQKSISESSEKDEIAGGTIVIPEQTETSRENKRTRRRKKESRFLT